MLSSVWLKPLLASINTPPSVIPTVSIRDCFGGFLVGINTELNGLSDIPLPTCSLRRTTEMLCFLSSFLGPMPLINNNWGLPIAPAETIISLPLFWLRKACCFSPFSSLNWTPVALGFWCPVQEMRLLWKTDMQYVVSLSEVALFPSFLLVEVNRDYVWRKLYARCWQLFFSLGAKSN